MPYQLVIDPLVQERFPGYSAVILYARGLVNGPGTPESTAILREAEAHCRSLLTMEMLANHPHIAAWRETYRAFGSKPKKYLCSVEALLTRVLKGNELPTINMLVDLYNAVSLKHVLPVGGEDWDMLASDLHLTFAKGDEPFQTTNELTYPDKGEVVWVDQDGVTCRKWNWRQGSRTRLSEETTNVYYVLDSMAPYSQEALLAASEELQALLRHFCPSCSLSSGVIAA